MQDNFTLTIRNIIVIDFIFTFLSTLSEEYVNTLTFG